MSVHYTLQAAIDTKQSDEHVLACDTQLTGRVGKKFMTCPNIKTEDGLKHFQRLIRSHGPHFYEILLPDRPTRIFVDIETENGVYEKVKRGVETFVVMLDMWINHGDHGGLAQAANPLRILDSSNSKKTSFHIVGGPLIFNPFHVGALVRRLTLWVYSARYEETQQKFDFESLFDNDNNYIVDEQIYTHNRQFRLSNMCKISPTPRYLKGCTTAESVLQNPVNIAGFHGWKCSEIDESEPVSTSKKATGIYTMIDGNWERTIPLSYTMKGVPSELPSKLVGLRAFCEVWMQHGQVGKCTFNVRNGTFRLATSCKRCSISQRFHKSNHTWLVVNPWQCEVYQMCFDENCMGKKFKVPVNESLWREWRTLIDKKVDISGVVVDGAK